MPLYEFECPACKTRFEELVRHSDRNEDVACPGCGRRRPDRLVSVTARGSSEATGLASAAACRPRRGFS